MAWWKCRVTWTGGGFTDGDGGTKEEAEENLRINVANDRLNNNGFNNVVSRECSLIVDDGGSIPPPPDDGGSIPLPPIIIDVFHIDLLFYDATVGEAEFYKTDGKGNLSLLKKMTGFRKTWQSIVPGDFGGGRFTGLLFYDATVGEGEFYNTNDKGDLSLLKKTTGFRKTWQSIVPGNFSGGNRFTDLLFYDAAAGEAEFYKTDGKGNLSLLKKTTGFRKTWQSIVPGIFGGGSGSTDLLFYDATAGEAEFYKTDGRGNLSLLKKLTGFRKTWQSIVPGNFGGGTIRSDLLFYDATTGESEFYKIDDVGNLSLLKKLTGFRKTWQSIVPGDFGDRT